MKPKPESKIFQTMEVCRLTGYSPKTLYLLADRGIVNPQRTSSGVRIWTEADIAIIRAHREAMRPQRLARLYGARVEAD